jgi:hypothetical protein
LPIPRPAASLKINSAPFETLFADLTELYGLSRNALAAVGETAITSLKTRPDDYQDRSDSQRPDNGWHCAGTNAVRVILPALPA